MEELRLDFVSPELGKTCQKQPRNHGEEKEEPTLISWPWTARSASLVAGGQAPEGRNVRAGEKNEEFEGERAVEEGLCFPLAQGRNRRVCAGPARQTWGVTSPGRVSMRACRPTT
jgi:hypothetical protein